MNRSRQSKAASNGKNTRRIIIFSAAFLLVAFVLVFSGAFFLGAKSYMDGLEFYIQEVPEIVRGIKTELETQKHVYESDALARGELGLKLYLSNLKPSDSNEVEWIRSMSSAESVSVVDANGKLLKTTGPATPNEQLQEIIPGLEPLTPVIETYYSGSGDEAVIVGNVLVMIPIPGESDKSLLFEFPCQSYLNVYAELMSWPDKLLKVYSEDRVSAFVLTEVSELTVYPKNGFSQTQMSQLKDELTDIIQRAGQDGSEVKHIGLVKMAGQIYLAVYKPFTEGNIDIVMAVPMWTIIRESLLSAIMLFGFVAANILLFLFYSLRCTQKETEEKDKSEFIRQIRRKTQPGFFIMLVATVLFLAMLLTLESRSLIARSAINKRSVLQYEIKWHEKQKKQLGKVYSDLYRLRAQVAASLLKESDYKTRKGLQELNNATQADYLMLFDNDGEEIISSNSYTGFSVAGPNANLSEEYKAMMLGYPSVVVGPAVDSYSKKMQISVAILLTKDDEQPDGFLLAVFDTDELETVLDSESLESTVMNFTMSGGNVAAVVKKEDGRFIAHTDMNMIGHDAVEVLDEEVLAGNYEGFTQYGGKSVYVSALLDEGKTYMVILFYRQNTAMLVFSGLLLLIVLVLELVEYLLVYKVCAEPVIKAEKAVLTFNESILIFLEGYAFYFLLLAVIHYVAALSGETTLFTFVFEGQWSAGVHLFSLWSVLFFVSVTFCIVTALRTILRRMELSVSPRGMTIIKMIDNVIVYMTIFFLVFYILYMFGVTGAALLAAISSVSVAFGFGARNLTADFLSGAFIIVENSVHVGDKVRIESTIGHVTNIGLRTIEVTDEENNVMIVNNSQVSRIVNLSRNNTPEGTPAEDNKQDKEETVEKEQ